MMYLKFDEITFEAAHYLPGYDGKCAGIHGHTYTVKDLVIRVSEFLDDQGIIVDFGKITGYFAKEWDHKFLIPVAGIGYWEDIYEHTGFKPMIDNRKVVNYGSDEYCAERIRDELMVLHPNIAEVHFTLYEGKNHGVSV